MAPVGPMLPGLATPTAPAVMAGEYSATAGLGGAAVSADSPAIGGLSEPALPAASPAAASGAAATPAAAAPAAEHALAAATKAQSEHPGTPARAGVAGHPADASQQGDAAHPADTHHNKPALPLPLLSLGGLRRKLQERAELRNIRDWRKELAQAPISEPWGRDELLGVLGLRPPGTQ